MCCHKSSVLMHGTSFSGVSFTRPSHAFDETAPALAGTSNQAATQSAASHATASTRALKGRRIVPPWVIDRSRPAAWPASRPSMLRGIVFLFASGCAPRPDRGERADLRLYAVQRGHGGTRRVRPHRRHPACSRTQVAVSPHAPRFTRRSNKL